MVEGKTGRSVTIQPVAWRLRRSGPRRDRRAPCRCGDAGAARPTSTPSPNAKQAARPTGRSACRKNSSPYTSTIVFLVRKGNPKAHQGLGRSGEAGRPGHHAQPEDLGRRALELPGGLGLGAEKLTATTRPRSRDFVGRSTSNVPVLDTGARGSTVDLRPARHRRRAARPGRTRPSWRCKEFGAGKFEIVVPPLSILAEPPVPLVDGNVDAQGHAQGRRGLSRLSLHAGGAGDHRASNFYRPLNAAAADPADLARFPKIELVTHRHRSSAAGPRRRPSISPMAACSTRSTSPAPRRTR